MVTASRAGGGWRVSRLRVDRDAPFARMADEAHALPGTTPAQTYLNAEALIARARDTSHAAALYRAGASHAVPETLESSLQLSEAVLVDLGVAMGPVIASIHEKRDEFRRQIKEAGGLDEAPKLKLTS